MLKVSQLSWLYVYHRPCSAQVYVLVEGGISGCLETVSSSSSKIRSMSSSIVFCLAELPNMRCHSLLYEAAWICRRDGSEFPTCRLLRTVYNRDELRILLAVQTDK